MLYIQDTVFLRQLDLLLFVAAAGRFRLSAWLYPDSGAKVLAGLKVVSHQGLRPITEYGNGTLPSRTELISANEETIRAFIAHESDIKAHCDSIALYSEGNSVWSAAIIGHEGMSLVRDESYLNHLEGAGFNVSNEPPAWW